MRKICILIFLVLFSFSGFAQDNGIKDQTDSYKIQQQNLKQEIQTIENKIDKVCDKELGTYNEVSCKKEKDELKVKQAGLESIPSDEQISCNNKFESVNKSRKEASDDCGKAGIDIPKCSSIKKKCEESKRDCFSNELDKYSGKNKTLDKKQDSFDKSEEKINDINSDILEAQQKLNDAATAISQAQLDKTEALAALKQQQDAQNQQALQAVIDAKLRIDQLKFAVEDAKSALIDLENAHDTANNNIKIGCHTEAVGKYEEGRKTCLENMRRAVSTGKFKTRGFGSFFSNKKGGRCSSANSTKYRNKYRKECLKDEQTKENIRVLKQNFERQKRAANTAIARQEKGIKEANEALNRMINQNKLSYNNLIAQVNRTEKEQDQKIQSARAAHQTAQARLAQLQTSLQRAQASHLSKGNDLTNLKSELTKIEDISDDKNISLEKIDFLNAGLIAFSAYNFEALTYGQQCCQPDDRHSGCGKYFERSAEKLTPLSGTGVFGSGN